MLDLAIISAIFGIILGNYFKILVLPVVILLGVTAIIIMGIVDREFADSVIWTCILFAVCLQAGYLGSALLQSRSFLAHHTSAQPRYPMDGSHR
jgi:hypothetical protein